MSQKPCTEFMSLNTIEQAGNYDGIWFANGWFLDSLNHHEETNEREILERFFKQTEQGMADAGWDQRALLETGGN